MKHKELIKENLFEIILITILASIFILASNYFSAPLFFTLFFNIGNLFKSKNTQQPPQPQAPTGTRENPFNFRADFDSREAWQKQRFTWKIEAIESIAKGSGKLIKAPFKVAGFGLGLIGSAAVGMFGRDKLSEYENSYENSSSGEKSVQHNIHFRAATNMFGFVSLFIANILLTFYLSSNLFLFKEYFVSLIAPHNELFWFITAISTQEAPALIIMYSLIIMIYLYIFPFQGFIEKIRNKYISIMYTVYMIMILLIIITFTAQAISPGQDQSPQESLVSAGAQTINKTTSLYQTIICSFDPKCVAAKKQQAKTINEPDFQLSLTGYDRTLDFDALEDDWPLTYKLSSSTNSNITILSLKCYFDKIKAGEEFYTEIIGNKYDYESSDIILTSNEQNGGNPLECKGLKKSLVERGIIKNTGQKVQIIPVLEIGLDTYITQEIPSIDYNLFLEKYLLGGESPANALITHQTDLKKEIIGDTEFVKSNDGISVSTSDFIGQLPLVIGDRKAKSITFVLTVEGTNNFGKFKKATIEPLTLTSTLREKSDKVNKFNQQITLDETDSKLESFVYLEENEDNWPGDTLKIVQDMVLKVNSVYEKRDTSKISLTIINGATSNTATIEEFDSSLNNYNNVLDSIINTLNSNSDKIDTATITIKKATLSVDIDTIKSRLNKYKETKSQEDYDLLRTAINNHNKQLVNDFTIEIDSAISGKTLDIGVKTNYESLKTKLKLNTPPKLA